MKRTELREKLQETLREWEGKTVEELSRLHFPIVVEHGAPEEDDYWEAELDLLEDTPGYLHISVAVSDGKWSAFVPLTESFLARKEGQRDRKG